MSPRISSPTLRSLKRLALFGAVVASIAVFVGSRAASAEQPAAAAARAFLDPRTGALTATRPEGVEALELGPRELEMLSASAQGLVVLRSDAAGVTVHLGNRFQQMRTATLKPDGSVEQRCIGPSGASPGDRPVDPRSGPRAEQGQ